MKARTRKTAVLPGDPITSALAAVCVVLGMAAAVAFGAPADGRGEDASAFGPEPSPASVLTLDDCLARAEETSPRIAASRANWEAAIAVIGRARGLPDPTITYAHYIDEVETRVGPQTRRLGLRQALPFFGKRQLRAEIARAAAEAEYQRYRAARLDVVLEVTRAFVEYAYLVKSLRIVSEKENLIRQLEAVATRAYANGEAPYADLMKTQIDLARTRSEHESLAARRRSSSAVLASAMGAPGVDVLPWPEAIPALAPHNPDVARGRLSGASPELLGMDSEVERATHARDLARRDYLPDLALGLEYIVTDEARMVGDDSGKDPLIASVSVAVPLWFGKHRSAAREAASALSAAALTRAQLENDLGAFLDGALYAAADAERRVRLHESELIPRAEQALASVRATYRTGSADFESLTKAELMVLDLELALERARADRSLASAELARLLGDGVPARPPDD